MFLKIGDRYFSLLAELFLGNISIEEIQTLILTEKIDTSNIASTIFLLETGTWVYMWCYLILLIILLWKLLLLLQHMEYLRTNQSGFILGF